MADLHLQHPDCALSFLEAAKRAIADANEVDFVVAFASRAGIERFFAAREVAEFLRLGRSLRLIVGISAVTNRAAVDLLSVLQEAQPSLRVQLFWDRTNERLFHPKFLLTRAANRAERLIVGSANLTPGGLEENFEAFATIEGSPAEPLDLTADLERFLDRYRHCLFELDDPDARARLSKNVVRGRRRRLEEADVTEVAGDREPADGDKPLADHVLIAYAPKGRGGASQLQINQAVLRRFFRIPPVRGEPLTLRHRKSDGTLGDAEQRSLLYSEDSNRNLKIEIGAARPWPAEGRPIVLFRSLGPRLFEYVYLDPGQGGYDRVRALLERAQDQVGRGVPRIIRTVRELRAAWPRSPIR